VIGGEDMKAHYHDRDTDVPQGAPSRAGKQYAIAAGEFAGGARRCRVRDDLRARPMLGIDNPEALILANDLCDLLGMDTISMGVTRRSSARRSSAAGSTPRTSACRSAGATGAGCCAWSR